MRTSLIGSLYRSDFTTSDRIIKTVVVRLTRIYKISMFLSVQVILLNYFIIFFNNYAIFTIMVND